MNSGKLRARLDNWISAGLISPEQAAAIGAYEDERKNGPSWGLLIFAGFGAVVLGLGVILLFAYNWSEMHKFAKLGVIFGALVLAHGAGLWMRLKKCPDGAAEAAHLLGTVLFGAGIFLVAQIYHVSSHYPDAFLIWGTGALLLTWAMPSIPQGVLASVLLCFWACAEAMDFDTNLAFAPLVILLGTGIPAWRLRSPVLLTAAAITFAITSMAGTFVNQQGLFMVLLAVSVIFFALARLFRRNAAMPQAAAIFRRTGLLLYLPPVFALSFQSLENFSWNAWPGGDFAQWAPLTILSLAAFVLAAWAMARTLRDQATRGTDFRVYLLAPVGMLAVFMACCWIMRYLLGDEDYHKIYASISMSTAANLVFLYHALAEQWRGCRETRPGLVTGGSVMLAGLIFARFTDMFESLLTRGAAFLFMGAVLFFVAVMYHRQRRVPPTGGKLS